MADWGIKCYKITILEVYFILGSRGALNAKYRISTLIISTGSKNEFSQLLSTGTKLNFPRLEFYTDLPRTKLHENK